jgi:hypothetical protein
MHFVLEYKGVEGHPQPYVPINQDQLLAYAILNDEIGQTFVWYLLPAWDIKVDPGLVLPAAAETRVLRATDPRADWRTGRRAPDPELVTKAPSTRVETAFARGCEAFFYVVDPLRLLEDGRLKTFPGWHGPTGFPVGLIRELAEGMTLEHFISLVGRGRLGIVGAALTNRRESTGGASDQPEERALPESRAIAHSIEPRFE